MVASWAVLMPSLRKIFLRWVWKIGVLALSCGILCGIYGYYQICDYMQAHGDVATAVLMGGYKCMMVPVIYGIIIFIISQLINIFQSPRI